MWKQILNAILWLVVRFFKRRDDPQKQYERARQENARIIADHDADGLNRKLDRLTDRVPDSSDSE